MLKRLGRSGFVQRLLGRLLGAYLKLVGRTNRFALDPPDLYERLDAEWPAILAMWHGQHFMVPLGKLPRHRYLTLISRHRDGEINAVAAAAFDIGAVRGSGGRPDQMRRKGGAIAMREMLRALESGISMTITADVPKTARVAGEGIVMLAQRSGRPILPVTVVTSRRKDFSSWDRASMGLPFGRGVIALGEPIRVARDADAAALEAARLQLEEVLDRLHERAYASLGARDPGAGLGLEARAMRRAGKARE
jgi:hypothetical protein